MRRGSGSIASAALFVKSSQGVFVAGFGRRSKNLVSVSPLTCAFRDCCCRCCRGTSTMILLPPLTSGGQRTWIIKRQTAKSQASKNQITSIEPADSRPENLKTPQSILTPWRIRSTPQGVASEQPSKPVAPRLRDQLALMCQNQTTSGSDTDTRKYNLGPWFATQGLRQRDE